MAKVNGYPGVTSFTDVRGKLRYRYRTKHKTVSLKGRPGDPEFEAVYQSIISGVAPVKAQVIGIPGATRARSMAAAWRLVKRSPDFMILDRKTQNEAIRIADRFLSSPVTEGGDVFWRDIPIADLKRRHIKHILSERIETPHAARRLLITIRKMIYVALDEEWIEFDPSARIKWRPKYKGFRSWTDGEISLFMEYWPPGTKARTVFSIALWLGLRRADIVEVMWSDVDFIRGRVKVYVSKGSGRLEKTRPSVKKLSPALISDLQAVNRRCDYVVTTEYGKKQSHKALTADMAKWTKDAGLPTGCTLHGLRKTLGKLAVEGGATTRMSMDLLDHTDIEHAELYSRDADQERLAAAALDCAVDAFNKTVSRKNG